MARSLLLVALIAAVAAGSAIAQEQEPPKDPIIGTLQNVEGVVLIKEGEQTVQAIEGQQLRKNQEVLVTDESRALIVFNDGCDLELDPDDDVYKFSDGSPCATLWWAGPGAAAAACGAAKVNKNSNSRTLAAIGLAAGAGLLGTSQGRERDFKEFAAALNEAEGDVMVVDENGREVPLRPGTRLRAEQEVLVKAGSRALIVFDDGCTQKIEVGGDDDDDKVERYIIPSNSPCMSPPLWWASAAVASGLCLSVEDEEDVQSP